MIDERYDTGTRIWTCVLGFAAAAVIDWLAVVNPARAVHPGEVGTGWWTIGLALVMIAPAGWVIGRLTARDYGNAIIWGVVLVALVLAQFVPLSWAQSQS